MLSTPVQVFAVDFPRPFAGINPDATYNGADTYFALSDWLGTKRVEVDAAGACATGYRSLPFGEQLAPAAVTLGGVAMPVCSTDATEHHFTGKEHDAETGNDYFGARYFNSGMGRWLSPDWSAKEEPVPYAKLDDPQTLNLYGYVGNNPVGRVDADGHDWPSWGDVANFVSAASNAFASDNAFGVGRQEQTTAAGRMGAAFGDFGAAVQGAVETVSGGSQMGGGVALCGTGAGCLVGAPEAVVGTAVATHGVAVAGTAGTHLLMAAVGNRGRSANDVKPDPQASGSHSVAKKNSDGKTVGYTTFNEKGGAVKRVDVEGGAHNGVDTPHVHEPKPGKGPGAPLRSIRPARLDELPH